MAYVFYKRERGKGSMIEFKFESLEKEIINLLSERDHMVFATCLDNRVTARNVSIINDGLKILFQTDKEFLKCQQIKENPNVALCYGNIQIEGRAQIAGHPLEHEFFKDKYQKYHTASFRNYSHLEDEVVIEVEPTFITLWKYDSDNNPLREYLMIEEKKAYREYYKKSKE